MTLDPVAPLAYLVLGLGLGRLPFDIRGITSAVLTRFVIPLVIIYNIATYRPGVFVIMGAMIVLMIIMFSLSRVFTDDPIEILTFSYLNIGWLGLPIAGAMFGDGAAMVIIAAYVGNSIFGNSVGSALLMPGHDIPSRLRRVLRTPSVWSLAVGVACIPIGDKLQQYAQSEYKILKFLLSLFGMMILGIWLSKTKIRWFDIKLALVQFVFRMALVAFFVYLFIAMAAKMNLALVTNNKPAMYLLCLLPPAANIIVLETHYLKTGRSANLIACGTLVSIVAIALYVGVFMLRPELFATRL